MRQQGIIWCGAKHRTDEPANQTDGRSKVCGPKIPFEFLGLTTFKGTKTTAAARIIQKEEKKKREKSKRNRKRTKKER